MKKSVMVCVVAITIFLAGGTVCAQQTFILPGGSATSVPSGNYGGHQGTAYPAIFDIVGGTPFAGSYVTPGGEFPGCADNPHASDVSGYYDYLTRKGYSFYSGTDSSNVVLRITFEDVDFSQIWNNGSGQLHCGIFNSSGGGLGGFPHAAQVTGYTYEPDVCAQCGANDRSYQFQMFQQAGGWAGTGEGPDMGWNCQDWGGVTGTDPEYDTFDIVMEFVPVGDGTFRIYTHTRKHRAQNRAFGGGCDDMGCMLFFGHHYGWGGLNRFYNHDDTLGPAGYNPDMVKVFLTVSNITVNPNLGGRTVTWGSVVVEGTPAAPPEVWVDDDWAGYSSGDPVAGHTFGYDAFATIQDGIDAVAGSTVNVAAGTYIEAILIAKPLILRGATAGVNKNGYTVPAGYAWDDTVESIINHPNPSGGYTTIVDIYDTNDVTFEGFVVQETNAVGNLNSSLVRVYAHTHEISNIVVRNNVIGPSTNLIAQDGAQGRMGLYLVNHPYKDKGIVNSTFSGNKIFDCKGNGDNVFLWSSYYDYSAPGPASMNGTFIEDNEIYGAHRSGIETAGGYSDLTIRNNSIYGNGGPGTPDLKYGTGILMIRGASDKKTCNGYGPVDVAIVNNEIYNNEDHGIYMGPNNQGVTITGNNIHDNGEDAIRVDLIGNYWNPDFDPNPGPYTCLGGSQNVSASFNYIENNGAGAQVIGTPTNGFILDAEYNWWGDSTGPNDPAGTTELPPCDSIPVADMLNADGLGNAVSDNVDYCPWRGAPMVITLPATDIGIDTAKLWGQIKYDGGEACQYRFIYRRSDDSMAHVTTWTGSVNTGQSFSQTLYGLSPGSLYYFRAWARNSFGESNWGNEQSFTTLPGCEADASLLLLRPNGGENLSAGSTYEITWETTGTMESVLIEYSTNNGTGWTTIDTIGNTGSYEWEVPNANSQECLVRVSCPGRPSVNDTSDDVFTIFQCSGIIPGDSNGDCYVNFLDFAATAECWLNCGNPFDPDCQPL